MTLSRRAASLVALLVLLVSGAVYFLTLTPTVPFWDSGEFIAVSYILGVPHPPGTPLFVLIGRVATLIPLGNIAQRVNAISAIAAALCVLLTYLSTLRLIRKAQGEAREAWHEWVAVAAAAVGALMLAFSDAFWENSVEAEVYQMMSLAQILVFWLGLKWWEAHDAKPTVGPLLLATYVMWLCVGLHLGVGIMGIPLIVLVFLVDRDVAVLFAMPFLSLLAVTMGLERMAGAVILLSTVTFMIYAFRGKLNGWAAGAGALLALWGIKVSFGDEDFTALTATVAAAAVLVPLVALALRRREGRVIGLCLLLMAAGYSTHVYLPIRAAQHPGVNEGAPATWDKLRDLLERKQYGEMNMMKRRGTLEAQLNKEFWRYFSRQWPLYNIARNPGDSMPKMWIGSTWDRPLANLPVGATIPLLLGLAGGIWQFTREKRTFMLTFVFLGLSTAGMILFLNFTDHEVRDRDYFFQSGYHAYAMWIGLGIAWFITFVRATFSDEGQKKLATVGTTALMGLMPAALCANLWYTHDRSGNWVAHDYAYNMLAPLAPNSYVFTNGDNDTFPLWYIQQVEGFRKDVRVVNLSLLNTDWYIRQLRDEEPKVPITFDDDIVNTLGQGAVLDSAGRIIYTNEVMVHHILETSRQGDGWSKQPYFAVTVPEHYGFDSQFALQGLVYDVKRDTAQAGFDEAATHKAMYETFKYRGLFTPDGSWDKKVFKDENASTLSRNYAAAHLQLAYYYHRRRELPKAITEMERIARMFPDFSEVLIPLGSFYMEAGDTAKALDLFASLSQRNPGDPEARYYHGAALAYRGRVDDAVREFDASIQLDPNYMQGYFGAYTALWQSGAKERAIGYLQRWIEGHPTDSQAMQLLDQSRMELGLPPMSSGSPGGAPGGSLPAPPVRLP